MAASTIFMLIDGGLLAFLLTFSASLCLLSFLRSLVPGNLFFKGFGLILTAGGASGSGGFITSIKWTTEVAAIFRFITFFDFAFIARLWRREMSEGKII